MEDGLQLKAMSDSGSMSCFLSEVAETCLLQQNPDMRKYPADDIVIVGFGGHLVTPRAVYESKVTERLHSNAGDSWTN